jgi:hypothetical protein
VDGQIDSITERWPVLLPFPARAPASFWEVTRTAGALPNFYLFYFLNFFFAASGCNQTPLMISDVISDFPEFIFTANFSRIFFEILFLGPRLFKIN